MLYIEKFKMWLVTKAAAWAHIKARKSITDRPELEQYTQEVINSTPGFSSQEEIYLEVVSPPCTIHWTQWMKVISIRLFDDEFNWGKVW